ncbi:MAG: hypothetical protein OXC29_23230 [Rhodococcus sp.]|nr:hypothetical protein [Rhodococcus sp. (in: high G+C Gram-positive bacteria)]
MAKSGITRKSHVRVGGTDWALDLDNDFADWTVAGTISAPGEAVAGQSFVDKLFVSAERQINIGRLLYGTNSKSFRDREEGYAFVIADPIGSAGAMWDGGPAIFMGLPEDASVGNPAIVHTASMLPADTWGAGDAYPFALTAADSDVELRALAAGEVVYVIVTEAAGTLRLTNGADHVALPGAAARVLTPDVSALGTAAVVSIEAEPALAGQASAVGYVLIGSNYEEPV